MRSDEKRRREVSNMSVSCCCGRSLPDLTIIPFSALAASCSIGLCPQSGRFECKLRVLFLDSWTNKGLYGVSLRKSETKGRELKNMADKAGDMEHKAEIITPVIQKNKSVSVSEFPNSFRNNSRM